MKNIKLLIIFIVIAVLSFYVYQTVAGKKSSLSKNALSDFAVEDTSSIDKIHLTDTRGNDLTFVKNDYTWTFENGECVQQHLIQSLLEAFKYISVKSPVGKNAVDNTNKMILAKHKKVEIFQNGNLSKTWYIGNATADHYGTFMLLKDPVKGKSPEPFIMFLPNMYGSVGDRFSTDKLQYLCSQIFAYDPSKIKEIDVEIPQNPDLSFRFTQNDGIFTLFNNDTRVEEFDTLKARQYFVGYKKIHFNTYNRTLPQTGVDSLRNSTPMTIIKVTDDKGDVNQIKAYFKGTESKQYDFEGNLLVFDRDNLWVFTNEDKLTKCQYYVFDKLLKDINYFKKEN